MNSVTKPHGNGGVPRYTFKVEKNIPVPLRVTPSHLVGILSDMSEVIQEMKSGESFLFDNIGHGSVRKMMLEKFPAIKFKIRVLDKKAHVCRIWITGFNLNGKAL